MRIVAALLGSTLALAAAPASWAICDPTTESDQADLAAARAAVEANCDCAGATSHGNYVQCAAAQIDVTLVKRSCRGRAKRCAARSTCGRPGFVTCCRIRNGRTKCRPTRSAAVCEAKGGTPGSCASCCDACPVPGSGPTCPAVTTSTTTTTTTTSVGTERCCLRTELCGAFGMCQDLTIEACIDAGGLLGGPGTCGPGSCPTSSTTTPPSACCIADQCLIAGLCECLNVHHGTFMLFQICSPTLCTTTTTVP